MNGKLGQNFQVDQRVMFARTASFLDNQRGTILGTSYQEYGCGFYIVLLDAPTSTHKALVMIESCLDPLNDY